MNNDEFHSPSEPVEEELGKMKVENKTEISNGSDEESKKLTGFQAFTALCKGYCAINILVLPKQFDNGGWLIGILAISIAACYVCICALKLL